MVVRAFVSFQVVAPTSAAFEAAIEITDKANAVNIFPIGDGANEMICIVEYVNT